MAEDQKQPRQLAFFMNADETKLYVRDVGNGVDMYHEVADLQFLDHVQILPPGSYCVSVAEQVEELVEPEVEPQAPRDPLAGL